MAGCCAGGGGRAECGREDEQEADQVAGVVEGAGDEEGEERGGEGCSGPGPGAVSVFWGHGWAFVFLELAGVWVVPSPVSQSRRSAENCTSRGCNGGHGTRSAESG